jgi:hypothetical protein
VFAGAAREAVFSQPEVIRRVNADFVPVALKAALVNNPPDNEEGRLYREIGRSKIAPQGICVVNSAGKVLDWVMMFDDEKNVPAFLNNALKRFAKYPDATEPVPAERYMKFPSNKLEDTKDNGKAPKISDRHPEGERCPAKPPLQKGTVVARVFGRALDKDGKPVADTVRQEHYVEDRFEVTVKMQEALAKGLSDAGAKRFRVGDDLARLLVSHAYLGQLDVNPVSAPGGRGDLKQCEFWAQKVETEGDGPIRLRLEGKSEAVGASREGGDGGDGRLWQHEVKLAWDGLIEIQENRITRLLLTAHGAEKLKWGNKREGLVVDVARLTAGHPIDLACDVRYGMIGAPVAADEAGAVEAPEQRPQEVPAEAGRQLMETLGPPFMVVRDKVQEELRLSEEQKKKLEKRLHDTLQDTMYFFQNLNDKKPEEREKELHAYVQKAQENLTAFLEGALKEEQFNRLRQVMLQREGLFALGHPQIMKELEITDKQRQQFIEVVQEFQKTVEPLVKEAQKDGKPEEIGPKVMKIRKEHEAKIEALLTDAQKKQWKDLLGKPFTLGD